MFALIQWIIDGLHSVIRLRAILKPRKEETDYSVGERIRTMWQGTELEAIIVDCSYRRYVGLT